MALLMGNLMSGAMSDLRVHPLSQRLRGWARDDAVVDSLRAHLVWEPGRLAPTYAVPVEDVAADLVPFDGDVGEERPVRLGDGPPVLDPRTPFTVHSTSGRSLTVRTPQVDLAGAAFTPDDPDLAGYVVLDALAFQAWCEEEEPVIGHPRDPFHRIDCLPSSRHVEVSVAGVPLVDTRRATMLLENPLPPRYYVPREDVRTENLVESELRTICPYKGVASYWSAEVDGERVADVAWTYEEPRHDAPPVGGMLCFFTERFDLVVDGVPVTRVTTPWS